MGIKFMSFYKPFGSSTTKLKPQDLHGEGGNYNFYWVTVSIHGLHCHYWLLYYTSITSVYPGCYDCFDSITQSLNIIISSNTVKY